MSRIISFTLWGNTPRYLVGAVKNAELQPDIYPGWKCRFYVDPTVPSETLLELTSLGTEIVHKPASPGYKGLFWRFEPGFEKGIERFIVRDCDSRINHREADAVREWESSKFSFHMMRDHKSHDTVILGAMWGAKGLFLPDFENLYTNFLNSMTNNPRVIKRAPFFYWDQIFLRDVV